MKELEFMKLERGSREVVKTIEDTDIVLSLCHGQTFETSRLYVNLNKDDQFMSHLFEGSMIASTKVEYCELDDFVIFRLIKDDSRYAHYCIINCTRGVELTIQNVSELFIPKSYKFVGCYAQKDIPAYMNCMELRTIDDAGLLHTQMIYNDRIISVY